MSKELSKGGEVEVVKTPQVCTALIKVPGEPIQGESKSKGLQLVNIFLEGANDPELSLLIGGDFYCQVGSSG